MESTKNNKHAYCIIAHNEPKILATLLDMIDDERNDIFLLVDKKTDIGIYDGIKAQKARLFFSPRVDIRWGDLSLVIAELTIFEFAYNHGPYQIYHLLSGVDLPIKNQDFIHEFITEHPNTEFVGFQHEGYLADLANKTNYYHFFMSLMNSPIKLFRKFGYKAESLSLFIQTKLGINKQYEFELKKGHEWCSITNKFISYLIENKNTIMKLFRYMSCADEIYKHTLIWNSEFRKRLYTKNGYTSCLREINWTKGNPYVWGSEDIEEDVKILTESKALFARKFSENHLEIVEETRRIAMKN